MSHKSKFSTPLSKVAAVVATFGLLVAGVTVPTAAANAVTTATSVGPATSSLGVAASSSTTLNSVLSSANDIVITGFQAADTVRVVVTASAGSTVQLTSTTNLSAVTGYTLNTSAQLAIGFTATTTNANLALATLIFNAGASSGAATINVVVSYANTGAVAYNDANGHYYEFKTTAVTWDAAKTAAAATAFNGLQGYLATSTTQAENTFIAGKVGTAAAWLGGADGTASGLAGGSDLVWRWVTGPEAGQRFFTQNSPSTGSSAPNGTNYPGGGDSNWNNGEPNGYSGNDENALQIVSGGTGQWNDLQQNSGQQTLGYVVEYGGMAGDALTYGSASRTITANVVATTPISESPSGACVQNVSVATNVVTRQVESAGKSYCVVEFKNAGNSTQWKSPTGVSSIDLLVVGGGGGAGTYGGGGAGEFVEKLAFTVTADNYYLVTTGAGGAGGLTTAGSIGATSSFDSVTAGGGGGGGTLTGPRASIAASQGATGASSGGSVAGNAATPIAGIAAIDDADANSFGFAGGAGASYSSGGYGYASGGGGGAGGVGGSGRKVGNSIYSGNGGLGKTSAVTGLAYAGGGAGGANRAEATSLTAVQGTAVSGGGAIGAAGAANTGGGGGATASTGISGLAGGSGVVALRYEIPDVPAFTTQPNGSAIGVGRTHAMTVVAAITDAGTLSYQWQSSPSGSSTWTNVSTATSASLTSAALALADSGIKYRVVATNTLNGMTSVAISNEATVSILTEVPVNVAFTELNFDHSSANTTYVNLKRLTTTTVGSTSTGTVTSDQVVSNTVTLNGKTVGDRVLYKNVTTRDGRTIDAIVTTFKTNGASITTYEDGAKAGGSNSYFQSDAAININNGYVEYKFDFYETSSTLVASCNAAFSCGAEVKVLLENVNVSAIDIDGTQWNDLSALNSFTVSNPTNLKYCAFTTGTLLTSCSANSAPGTYPGNVRFQGPEGGGTNRPGDMAIANYASVLSFSVKFGRSTPSDSNYYGVAFKALSWGGAEPQTVGDSAASFNLTYNGNGSTSGTAPATQTGAVGSQFTISANSGSLVRAGYTFAGWNSAANGSGTSYAVGSTLLLPKDGVSLYAIWTPSQITLAYSANGGAGAPANAIANAGSAITLSTQTPTRSGFTFTGWNTLIGGTGTSYLSGASFTMPGANTTLYAAWSSADSTITYDGNSSTSGTEPASLDDTSGVVTTVSANSGSLLRTGYTFAGWNTAADGSGTDYAVGASVTYPADGITLTLYAKWTAAPYSLAYNSNGGSAAPASVSKLAGSVFALPASNLSPTRDGYTFAGWNTLAAGSGTNTLAGVNFTMPAANTTLYAKWTVRPFNVTYLVNAPATTTGTGLRAATTGNFGQAVTIADAGTFAVTNYRFVGWNTLATGLGTDYVVAQTLSMPVDGITLYAKWVLATIKLTYSANGGNGAPADETRVANTLIALPTDLPTKAGYNFLGWCADLSSCPTPLAREGAYTVPSADTVLYAKWGAIDYTLSYEANGGSGAPSLSTSNVGLDVVVSATVPTRTGYTFLGWNTLIGATGTDYAAGANFRMGAASSVLYAKWQGNPFTLTYNSNGGSTLNPSSEGRSAGSVANLASNSPIKTGFSFTGWNTQLNGSGTSYSASASLTMPGSNVTLYAQWTALSNGVTYDANGGTGAPAGITGTFGSSVTVSVTVPTRTGFRFTGWNSAANGSGTGYSSGASFTIPATSVVLYAQWASSNYTLSYDANGGSGAPASSSIVYDPAATANATVSSTVPTRLGYDFLGWNTSLNGTGTARAAAATFAMPAADVTLYAQWSLATFAVYYNANGGAGTIASQPGRYNATITLRSTQPTRTGYSFAGWNTASDNSGSPFAPGATFTVPGANTTLYAQWTALTYVVTYVANGGSVASLPSPSSITGKTLGEAVTLSNTVPTYSSHYFTGWNTVADGSGTSYASGSTLTVPAANVSLYAQWTLDIYKVSYNANGGSGEPADQEVVTPPSLVVSATLPTRPGYIFLGWNTNAAASVYTILPSTSYTPSGNTVLYAIWEAATITLTYDLNGGTGVTPTAQTGPYGGSAVELASDVGFTKLNSTFLTWNTQSNGSGTSYLASEPRFVLPSTNLTLFAIWSAPYFAVEFDSNGGSTAPVDQFAAPAETVVLTSAKPSKTDVVFSNWTDVSTGATYNAGDTITMPSSNVSLVANYIQRASVPGGGNYTIEEPTTDPTTGGGKSTASGTKVTTITPNVSNAASQCLEDPIDGKCKAVVVIKGKGTWTLTNGVAKFVPVKGFVGKSIVVHRVTSKSGLIAKANLEAVYTKRPPVTINIGNFIDGSPRITALIGSKIRAFIKRYADYRTIECVGFTEGPTVLKTDKWLSNQRAINACGFVKTNLKKKFVQLPIKAAQGTVEARENRRITITLRD